MATGLTVADNDISVGGRTVVGARMGRVQYDFITHTSDTALATQAGGGSQIGSAVSMVIPAAGIIRLTILEMEHDETEGNVSDFALGLKVGADAILWAVVDLYDGTSNYVGWQGNASVSSLITTNGWSADMEAVMAPMTLSWDIVGRSITSGSAKDVEVWMGDNVNSRTGETTITGTTTTARFLVEIIDGS